MMLFGKANQAFDLNHFAVIGHSLAIIPSKHLVDFAGDDGQGWRTSTSHGGYVARRSEDPNDLYILNSKCTHLACTVNWSENDKVYLCPCHDAKFGEQGQVLDGPPPRPLDRYEEHRVTEEGVLEIYYKA